MASRAAPDATRSPTTPYGRLVETRVRIVTWNLWWRLGDWEVRAAVIADTLVELRPDLVCLQEVWQEGARNQAGALAERLGIEHAFALDRTEGKVDQGVAVLSRWPLTAVERRPLPTPHGLDQSNVALRAIVRGPRGPLALVTTHLTPYPTRSEARERQVRALVEFMAERSSESSGGAARTERLVHVVAGDFNAVPDADEIRLLTGRRAPAVPGWMFLDAWTTAGDGSPGHTVARANPNAAPLLLPDSRWDYVFVSWPSGPGGVGHPVHAEVVGRAARNGVVPSDHYAVLADLRY